MSGRCRRFFARPCFCCPQVAYWMLAGTWLALRTQSLGAPGLRVPHIRRHWCSRCIGQRRGVRRHAERGRSRWRMRHFREPSRMSGWLQTRPTFSTWRWSLTSVEGLAAQHYGLAPLHGCPSPAIMGKVERKLGACNDFWPFFLIEPNFPGRSRFCSVTCPGKPLRQRLRGIA